MSKRNVSTIDVVDVGAANNDPRLKKSKNIKDGHHIFDGIDVDTMNYYDIRLKETENKKDEKDVIIIDNADASFARILQEEEYHKSLSENLHHLRDIDN